jgi:small-conductance mechanosensitive channel
LSDVLREQLRHFSIVIRHCADRVDRGAGRGHRRRALSPALPPRYRRELSRPQARHGAAGLILSLAARPLLSNLIAGVQIAVAQPIRTEDAVIIENEWDRVEDIASTYVVIRLWDWRRVVVPLSYFIERPFQNWTRDTQSLIGAIAFHVYYCTDVSRIRQRLEPAVRENKLWDGAVVNLRVIEASPRAIELRALVSSRSAPQSWDLRCEIREKLLAFIREEMPEAFPRERAMVSPPLAGFGGAFERGDALPRPVPARAHD